MSRGDFSVAITCTGRAGWGCTGDVPGRLLSSHHLYGEGGVGVYRGRPGETSQ